MYELISLSMTIYLLVYLLPIVFIFGILIVIGLVFIPLYILKGLLELVS